jgi:hypothetical protein
MQIWPRGEMVTLRNHLCHGLCEKENIYTINEVWFRCGNHSSVAKIDRGFTDFKIKFIIGIIRIAAKNTILKK